MENFDTKIANLHNLEKQLFKQKLDNISKPQIHTSTEPETVTDE